MGKRMQPSLPDVSIVFRALNEETWFEHALVACRNQELDGLSAEIILVDSGSTDRTLEIAERHDCRIVHIPKNRFTFGRSLNWGCEAARGKYLIFISAHCVPTHQRWLLNLIAPLRNNLADYTYGRQIGNDVTKFSERQIFGKYFPDFDQIPQQGFFCNNANAAIGAELWRRIKFDEEVTGLEDMVLAKKIVAEGGRIGYVSDAPVTHVHDETFRQVSRRYYREALTLRDIMPEVHFYFTDFLRYASAGVFLDLGAAIGVKQFRRYAAQIVAFRIAQYWGTYRGHNEHRKLSRAQKESYYFPKAPAQPARIPAADKMVLTTQSNDNQTQDLDRTAADESAQRPRDVQEFPYDRGQAAVPVDPRYAAVRR
jgi:rhamnosyltransferase